MIGRSTGAAGRQRLRRDFRDADAPTGSQCRQGACAPRRWRREACRRARTPRAFVRRRRTGGVTRSRSGSGGPAGSVAATRTAVTIGQRKARADTGERAAEARPKTAQAFEPRLPSRRQRCCEPGNLDGGWMFRVEQRRFAHSLVFAAPKIAAPTAFAHRIRDPSALHSQAGAALVAWSASWAASRGSRDEAANSDSTIDMRRNSLPNEFLIVRAARAVHAGPSTPAGQGGITLIAPRP